MGRYGFLRFDSFLFPNVFRRLSTTRAGKSLETRRADNIRSSRRPAPGRRAAVPHDFHRSGSVPVRRIARNPVRGHGHARSVPFFPRTRAAFERASDTRDTLCARAHGTRELDAFRIPSAEARTLAPAQTASARELSAAFATTINARHPRRRTARTGVCGAAGHFRSHLLPPRACATARILIGAAADGRPAVSGGVYACAEKTPRARHPSANGKRECSRARLRFARRNASRVITRSRPRRSASVEPQCRTRVCRTFSAPSPGAWKKRESAGTDETNFVFIFFFFAPRRIDDAHSCLKRLRSFDFPTRCGLLRLLIGFRSRV